MTATLSRLSRPLFAALTHYLMLACVLAFPIAVKAAGDPGDTESVALAAEAYHKGSYAEAIKLAHPAAENGHAAAQYLMGSAFANAAKSKTGLSEPQADEADSWLRKAAAQGHVPAMRDLGHLNLLYRETSALQEGARWYSVAAKKGDVEAQIFLGLLKASPQDAYIAFGVAAGTGDVQRSALAISLANAMRGRLTPDQLAVSQQTIDGATRLFANSPPTEPRPTEQGGSSRTEVATHLYMASLPQLRFGNLVGRVLKLDAVFGALKYPAGGLIGKN
jgi:TPR repeat protein